MTYVDHYGQGRASRYEAHHRKDMRTRWTSYREGRVLLAALREAGYPRTALDLPCGTGRFWPVFAAASVERLIGGDASKGMLEVAHRNRSGPGVPATLIETSAFSIDLPDGAVEFAACLRFYHHLSMPEDRMRVLRELRRVSTGRVAISLWVDGNLAGNRRMLRKRPEPRPGYGRRICRPRAEVEAEFRDAGFRILRHYDVWPLISMWRLYVLCADG